MYQNLYEQRFLELQFFSYVSGIGVRPVTPVVCVYWLDCERILGDALSCRCYVFFSIFYLQNFKWNCLSVFISSS